jgi:hypothetical protein
VATLRALAAQQHVTVSALVRTMVLRTMMLYEPE